MKGCNSWKNLEGYKGESNEKGWQEGEEGGCELAAVEVGRDLYLLSEFSWEQAGRVRGAAGKARGAVGKLTAPAVKRWGFIFFLSFHLPPMGARKKR